MSDKKLSIACVIGTRPEVIKMAPVIEQLNVLPFVQTYVISTAQHRKLLDDMLKIFSIEPDVDLDIMQENQSLSELNGNLFIKMEQVFKRMKFDFVVAQGDTTTTLVAAQISFYHRIPFAHVEAGLRSYNFYEPFPEELNRVFVSKLAKLHFAPTKRERNNLLLEHVPDDSILVTGNTVIDSLYLLSKRKTPLPFSLPSDKRIILVTLHRRESFGEPVKNIFAALIELTRRFSDIYIVYPVHPNPNVHDLAYKMLDHQTQIKLLQPIPYDVFVSLMNQAYLIMSDSGGIQEEAPALNKPILILRDITERPLITELGLGILVGSNKEIIIEQASLLLSDLDRYHAMQKNISPYGDGEASKRIVEALISYKNKDHA